MKTEFLQQPTLNVGGTRQEPFPLLTGKCSLIHDLAVHASVPQAWDGDDMLAAEFLDEGIYLGHVPPGLFDGLVTFVLCTEDCASR